MANKNKNIFSADFVSAVKAAVSEYLELNDLGDNCVSAFDLAAEKVFKAFREADGSEIHPQRLRLMIMSVVSTGQASGLAIRKGRDGGIYRTKAAAVRVRKPAAKVGKAENETVKEAAEAKTA